MKNISLHWLQGIFETIPYYIHTERQGHSKVIQSYVPAAIMTMAENSAISWSESCIALRRSAKSNIESSRNPALLVTCNHGNGKKGQHNTIGYHGNSSN